MVAAGEINESFHTIKSINMAAKYALPPPTVLEIHDQNGVGKLFSCDRIKRKARTRSSSHTPYNNRRRSTRCILHIYELGSRRRREEDRTGASEIHPILPVAQERAVRAISIQPTNTRTRGKLRPIQNSTT